MSWLSNAIGLDGQRERRENARWAGNGGTPGQQYQNAIGFEGRGGGWADAFAKTAGAFVQNQMPEFQQRMQGTREDAIRRGISTGDLGTSYEGDLTSAFQRNIANALGGLAMSGYENNRNRYLDLLTGQMDRDQAHQNQNREDWMTAAQLGVNIATRKK